MNNEMYTMQLEQRSWNNVLVNILLLNTVIV
jgi:hypothetical protein